MTTTTDYDTCEIDELDRLLAIVDDPRQALLLHHRRAERLGALDPPAAMEAAGDALKIAAGVSDRREHCHALIVAARYAVENDELERAARHLDRAASMLRHLPDPYPHDESRLHHYRGRLLMASGDYTAAMALHQRALELASERRDIEMMAAAEVAIGESRIQRGEYPAALEHLLRAEALCEEGGDERALGRAHHLIAQANRVLGRHDLELHHLHRMLECAERTGITLGIGIAIGEIGLYHYERSEVVTALEYLSRARCHFEAIRQDRYLAYAELFLGMVYSDMKEYEKGGLHYCSALSSCAVLGDRMGRSSALIGMAEARMRLGEWGAALEHAREALAIGEELDSRAVQCRAYQILAEIHEGAESFREAVECYHACMRLKDELGGPRVVSAAAQLQAEADAEAAERERREYAEKIERLERRMEGQTRELASMALHLTQKGKVVARLKEEVLPMVKNGDADPAELARMLQRQIESDGVGESEWRSFDRQFGRMQEGFLRSLAGRYPTLTRSELRLCMLLRQELASKEIANILNISLATVQTHRRRIRKKLGLAADAGLTQFLLAIG